MDRYKLKLFLIGKLDNTVKKAVNVMLAMGASVEDIEEATRDILDAMNKLRNDMSREDTANAQELNPIENMEQLRNHVAKVQD